MRDYQKPFALGPHVIGEGVTTSSNYSSKKKKTGSYDPRFKRILNPEARDDSNAELSADKVAAFQKVSTEESERVDGDILLKETDVSYLKTVPVFESRDFKKVGDQKKGLEEVATKDARFNSEGKFFPGIHSSGCAQTNFQDVLNLKNYKDLEKSKVNSKTNLRRSASDCRLLIKHTFGEDNEGDVSGRIRVFPSATRINKVHNWIKDYKVTPEKRRSVVTVIGETQTKPLKEILKEINQRRKLAKELDKHAFCEAIMESAENKQSVKNLVAKVDFVLPDGKVIYSTEKVYLHKEISKFKIDENCKEYAQKNIDVMDANDSLGKRSHADMIPERDSSASQIGKKNKMKRCSRKLTIGPKEKLLLKDKTKPTYIKNSCRLYRFCLLLLFLFSFIGGFYRMIASNNIFTLSEFFRPKTAPWYEKLLL